MLLRSLIAGLVFGLTSHMLFATTVSDDSIAINLEEIVVKTFPRKAKLTADGFEIKIAGTYLANTGTALDLLGKMPFISTSGAGIDVIGKGSPIVFIDGRQVRDQTELDRLSSANIKNVALVTSPGARYDSSVNAVIRITTVAPAGEGVSFNDRTTMGYKHYAYLFEQFNLNYRKNGFDIFGMLNYENYRERPQVDNSSKLYLKSVTVNQNSLGWDFTRYPVYEGKIGLNYNSGNHYAGFFYDFAYRPAKGTSFSFTSRLLNSLLEDELTYSKRNERKNRQHLLSAYYTGSLGKWLLTANLDAMWQIHDHTTHEKETSAANPERLFITHNDVFNRFLAGNITAYLTVWRGSMHFGSEISDIYRKDLYLSNGDFIEDTDTKIKETTTSLFADLSQTFGKVTLSVGLRWEHTDSKYYLWNEKKDDQSRRYHNIAPNASLSFPIGNVSVNLASLRKTTRPSFEQLRSSVSYLDRYSYETGNPNLKPIYRDYITLSGAWRDLIIEFCWCSTKNYFMWETMPYPGNTEATLLRMENMPRYNTYEMLANYSPSFVSIWRPTFMAGIMAQDFKLINNGTEMILNKPLGVFRFDNAIHLPWDIWFNIDFSAKTSGNGDNAYMKGQWQCDLGLNKSLFDDRWSVKLQLNDLFNTYRQQFTAYDALTTMKVSKIFDTRDLSLTIRYNFNEVRSRFKGHGAANSEKERF